MTTSTTTTTTSSTAVLKSFLFNGKVYQVGERDVVNGMPVYYNGQFICSLRNYLNYFEWMTTQELLSNMYRNYCGSALYDEQTANYQVLQQLGGFISSNKKKELGFAPSYYKIYDRICEDPMMSSNGGDYTDSRNFNPTEDGRFIVSYHTSADFTYCSACGTFNAHNDCEYEIVDVLPEGAQPRW